MGKYFTLIGLCALATPLGLGALDSLNQHGYNVKPNFEYVFFAPIVLWALVIVVALIELRLKARWLLLTFPLVGMFQVAYLMFVNH